MMTKASRMLTCPSVVLPVSSLKKDAPYLGPWAPTASGLSRPLPKAYFSFPPSHFSVRWDPPSLSGPTKQEGLDFCGLSYVPALSFEPG